MKHLRNYALLLIILMVTVTITGAAENACVNNEETVLVNEESASCDELLFYWDIPMTKIWQSWVRELSVFYGIEPELVIAICKVESGFDKNAKDYVNGTHHGLMQLGPGARKYCNAALQQEFDYFNEFQNVEAGIFYLSGILAETENYSKALMVYNLGGPKAKELWRDGITSTQYSEKVLLEYEKLKEEQRYAKPDRNGNYDY